MFQLGRTTRVPMVSVEREGDNLRMNQRRFTYLDAPSDQEWLIPVSVRVFYGDGRSKETTTLLDSKSALLDIGAGAVAYKLNDGQSGFYRVQYRDEANLKELGELIATGGFRLWTMGDPRRFYAMVKRGDARMQEYLEFLAHYVEENVSLPLSGIARTSTMLSSSSNGILVRRSHRSKSLFRESP